MHIYFMEVAWAIMNRRGIVLSFDGLSEVDEAF